MAYADYTFYETEYGGKAVGPDDFNGLANRASAYIDGLTMGRAEKSAGKVLYQVKMAMCSLVEIFRQESLMESTAYSEKRGISSEKVGNYSVAYVSGTVSTAEAEYIEAKKKNAIFLYLGNTGLLKARSYPCIHHTP